MTADAAPTSAGVVALNVPVLPVTVGTIPGEMLQQLHVVSLEDISADLENALRKEALVVPVEQAGRSDIATLHLRR
jgi:hypothetical protein